MNYSIFGGVVAIVFSASAAMAELPQYLDPSVAENIRKFDHTESGVPVWQKAQFNWAERQDSTSAICDKLVPVIMDVNGVGRVAAYKGCYTGMNFQNKGVDGYRHAGSIDADKPVWMPAAETLTEEGLAAVRAQLEERKAWRAENQAERERLATQAGDQVWQVQELERLSAALATATSALERDALIGSITEVVNKAIKEGTFDDALAAAVATVIGASLEDLKGLPGSVEALDKWKDLADEKLLKVDGLETAVWQLWLALGALATLLVGWWYFFGRKTAKAAKEANEKVDSTAMKVGELETSLKELKDRVDSTEGRLDAVEEAVYLSVQLSSTGELMGDIPSQQDIDDVEDGASFLLAPMCADNKQRHVTVTKRVEDGKNYLLLEGISDQGEQVLRANRGVLAARIAKAIAAETVDGPEVDIQSATSANDGRRLHFSATAADLAGDN